MRGRQQTQLDQVQNASGAVGDLDNDPALGQHGGHGESGLIKIPEDGRSSA